LGTNTIFLWHPLPESAYNERMKAFKTMCDIRKKDWKQYKKELKSLTRNPTHICKKCGVRSNDKSLLCKAEKL